MNESNRTAVCLCGSTKFPEAFREAALIESLNGKIVLSVGGYLHQGDPITPAQKTALDNLHLDKIDAAEETLFLNVKGYIGDSTCRELAYAILKRKKISFLIPALGEKFMEDNARRLGAFAPEFMKAGRLASTPSPAANTAPQPEAPKNCPACMHSGMDMDDPGLVCGHPDSGSCGTLLQGPRHNPNPMTHCGPGRTKFEQHPLRNPNGSLK